MLFCKYKFLIATAALSMLGEYSRYDFSSLSNLVRAVGSELLSLVIQNFGLDRDFLISMHGCELVFVLG